ncbi:hypothetical protein Afil01_10430 [Actinorhabdospora filicis]|uniref:non-specific serine/threonine protein kinase n=1 Tax=Actinorhabdospora filicis TaxID=1785913 RepID=A0A9W6W891_9ACTN|nr:serine/threonine-protein kinase [Actinorhabdospora filicis]GLZ76236.1 hypothetical protein Afil01_10430 [Actinorhabdospora filicis]
MTDLLAARYALGPEVARGAAGTVYRAVDTATGDTVAVKVLRHDAAAEPGVVTAFLDEAEVLAELDHPGIVRPRDFIATDDVLALVMDLVEGTDLREKIRVEGPLAPAAAAIMISQLAAALAAVHAVGLVHGDVKPGNVLVPADGSSVRLADFGVAHRITGDYSPTHGTPEYVAPEIVRGGASSGRSDVYGVGLILYEALTSRSPYRGGPIDEVLKRHEECAPAPIPGCPPQLWSLITSCTQVDPALRPDAADIPARVTLALPSLLSLPPLDRVPPTAIAYESRQMGTNRPGGTVGPDGSATSVMQIASTVAGGTKPAYRDRRVLIGAGVLTVVALAALGAYVLFGGSSGEGTPDPGRHPAAVSSENSEIPTAPTDPASPEPSSPPSSDPTLGPETDPGGDDTPTNPGDGNDNGEIPQLPGSGPIGSSLPHFP